MYTYTHTHCESVSHSLSGGAPEEEEDDHHHRHHHHSLVNDVSVYRQLARRETNMAALSLLPIATPGHSNSTQTAKEELSLNSAHHPPKVHTQSLIFPHRRATREFLSTQRRLLLLICPPLLLRSTPAAYRRRSKLDDDDAPHLFLHSDAIIPPSPTSIALYTHLSCCCCWLLRYIPWSTIYAGLFCSPSEFFFFLF